MNSLGIVRRMDELGRVVVPKEMRRVLNINPKDPLEISVRDGAIIVKKYEAVCMFCHSSSDLVNYEGYNICKDCLEKIKNLEK